MTEASQLESSGRSISVIVPALNEQMRLKPTVDEVLAAVGRWFADYELLIVDDGSTDDTGRIADKLAQEHRYISVQHNAQPSGLGGAFRLGLARAQYDYAILINGKNDIAAEELEKIFARCGQADMVIPYTRNQGERSWGRRALSRLFTMLLNVTFGLRLHYYNHSVLHRRQLLAALPLRTNSYAFQAEILIKLLKRGCSFVEVGVVDRFDPQVRTKAFRWSNIAGVTRFYFACLRDVYFAGKTE